MESLATSLRTTQQHLAFRIAQARQQTDDLFHVVREEAMYDRPIAERHRIVFYLGHVEAFDWNLLGERAFGLAPFNKSFDRLFAFGIDPVDGGLPSDQPGDWPARGEVNKYNARLRAELDAAIHDTLLRPSEGHPELLAMLETAIEHRLMHAETLAYMLHRLPGDRKIAAPPSFDWKAGRTKSRLVDIPEGRATLGLQRVHGDEFGWDNEFESQVRMVPEFAIDAHDVTNRSFLRFMQAGGYSDASLWTPEGWAWKEKNHITQPSFWLREGNLWAYRTMFGEIPLPMEWPVYVSHAEAAAYAKWLGRRLPSEEQFHRAAYGAPKGAKERRYPWGDASPTESHGNFDFRHWDPAPVGAHPGGASAFGVHDLVGNGWEWTRTVFAPFEGFQPRSFYPGYSANFFDGKHFVMKGGSPRTAACMLRRSFRNWFQPHYPNVYATFRCVED
ncbi:MAG TPA: SUMF1/EgtB/PvdO family nonheme iron enzyme [Candidatus Acidoferrum sp.]|nr:SUMF1/EgtB/PvdO family nonheme iron enzyme [Candidatus Acidoferrum sp.]